MGKKKEFEALKARINALLDDAKALRDAVIELKKSMHMNADESVLSDTAKQHVRDHAFLYKPMAEEILTKIDDIALIEIPLHAAVLDFDKEQQKEVMPLLRSISALIHGERDPTRANSTEDFLGLIRFQCERPSNAPPSISAHHLMTDTQKNLEKISTQRKQSSPSSTKK